MNTYSRWISGALIVSCVTLFFSIQVRVTSAEGTAVYVAAGDSVAAGIGASLPRTRSYPALVRDLLESSGHVSILLENVAVPGETTGTFLGNGQLDAVLAAIESAQNSSLPIIAISLSLGGNEMLRLRTSGITDREQGLAQFSVEYREALAAIRRAVGPDVPIVATTYYELTDGDGTVVSTDAWWLRQFNDVIRQAAGETDALIADIEPVFVGSIPEYTYYPFDVHPTNAGHAAIARTVSQALQLPGDEPAIEIVSSLETSRQTPTLRFRVRSDIGVATVNVASHDVAVQGPFVDQPNEYVALLDFGVSDDGEADAVVTISATDALGRESAVDVTVSLVSGTGSAP